MKNQSTTRVHNPQLVSVYRISQFSNLNPEIKKMSSTFRRQPTQTSSKKCGKSFKSLPFALLDSPKMSTVISWFPDLCSRLNFEFESSNRRDTSFRLDQNSVQETVLVDWPIQSHRNSPVNSFCQQNPTESKAKFGPVFFVQTLAKRKKPHLHDRNYRKTRWTTSVFELPLEILPVFWSFQKFQQKIP